ncbi:hypothetical protein JAAARDRAFT_36283 [Jaapia argillacea MUCL 33604]|uniref:Uncharacterized protein n=1 Tax=Jaapia argillacea MUCL 33604 TaxID=933084 RepID=A0A067PPS5_9AGAM|nr:hypothetical protein JAAARDRAFT_36283 [Jaapia argillacea MUCL 33604]
MWRGPLDSVLSTMWDASQIVLDEGNFGGFHVLSKSKGSIWLDSLAIPAYLACASALLLLSQAIFLSKPLKKLYARLRLTKAVSEEGSEQEPTIVDPQVGFFDELRAHIQSHGGAIIYGFKVARLVSVLALLGLSVATLILDENGDLGTLKKHGGEKRKSGKARSTFTRSEWLEFALSMTYVYIFILSMFSVCARAKVTRGINRHVVLLLLGIFGVYAYRDLWPLTTFTLSPMDSKEGWLLWTKIGVLSFVGIFIPLAIPRQYVPYDPKEPMETNPEQTASILSLALYSFLDPVVYTAYKVPHLKHEQLPALSDYDHAKNLVKRSFKHLDTFAGAKKQHLFWGLMKVFFWEYVALAALVIVKVIAGFASPVGINRLLYYLENNGEDAVVRPWVWIAWLFIGPLVGSLAIQWYIFITTGTLVRTEGIITQLVFEHALRIRMKAEVNPSDSTASAASSTPSTAVHTPDSASIAEVEHEPSPSGSGDDNTSTTARDPSVASTATAKGKDKQKGKEADKESIASSKSKKDKEKEKDDGGKGSNLVGKINNLVTTDLGNLVDGRDFLWLILMGPLQIIISLIFLYLILGWSVFVGLAVMILLFPLPAYIAQLMQNVQAQRMKRTDARVQTVTETMNVLRMIKLFGWESKTAEQVAEKREEELTWLWKRQVLALLNGNINYIIPVAHMIATYIVYTLVMKKQLSASIVFSSMAVFDILREQLFIVFFMIPQFIQAKVSLDRVNDFLHDTELLDQYSTPTDVTPFAVLDVEPDKRRQEAIGFSEAMFSWSNEINDGAVTPSKRTFRLRVEEELLFKPGCINLIIGPTGSGKTSLLMALLGEMHFIPSGPGSWFNLPRNGGVAYAAQESWVQNESIKDNILFGAPYDEERYQKVIYQCALTRDLTLFDAGDKTEVGEKGLTLSGGQKARITLARAVYSSAKILLLDDVLAALDVHTSKWIVDKCFRGDLIRGRTVILVTHNVALASPAASFVISLGSDGRILSQGSVSDALAKDQHLSAEVAQEKAEIDKAEEELDSAEPAAEGKKGDGKLVVAEEIAEGHVSWSAIKMYLIGMGGSWPTLFWIIFLGTIALCELANTIQTWFLGYWATQYRLHPADEVSVPYYLTVYVLLLLAAVVTYCFGYLMFYIGSLRASRTLHKQLITSVLGTTLRWLDMTPTSRVITRCTQDIRAVDGPVFTSLGNLLEITISMLIKFVAVVVFTPIFVIPGVVVAVLGGWIGQIYMKAQLSVKREMSNAKSPVLGHFGAAIAGIVSIRAYSAQSSFRTESLSRIDRYTKAGRTFYNLNRWICVRIDALGGFFAAALAGYLVYGQQLSSASNTGFSLTMAVGFSGMILWWVRILNQFEVDGNSLERIQQYVTIEQEPKPTESGVPPAYWPSSGNLRVEKLSARYSADGPKVLHDISFDIKSGERVGIVGRTGSGKSSLTLSLLRCIPTEGKVYFDGLPVDSMNLDALRSKITIIPQVPELLSGTLRQNLDPFSQHDDAALNDALRHAGLFSLQNEDDEGRITLDSPISSGGGNLSVGQRQILALARAILRQSKLLILDEATSAIDYKTDTVIQSSLRHQLSGDVTIITIAHRLQTIMDADKIMVLDAGRIAEFGSPSELLKNEKGMLRSLVDESNDKFALYAMASGEKTL